jgi:hypothetical protein
LKETKCTSIDEEDLLSLAHASLDDDEDLFEPQEFEG